VQANGNIDRQALPSAMKAMTKTPANISELVGRREAFLGTWNPCATTKSPRGPAQVSAAS
jgi:hypothetical protein